MAHLYEGLYAPQEESEDEGLDDGLDACENLYSEDQHDHVNPSDFVVFLFDKGIDINYFFDLDYLNELWVDYHGGENPYERECDLYGSLCRRSDCTNF